jgi:hypothetical protein
MITRISASCVGENGAIYAGGSKQKLDAVKRGCGLRGRWLVVIVGRFPKKQISNVRKTSDPRRNNAARSQPLASRSEAEHDQLRWRLVAERPTTLIRAMEEEIWTDPVLPTISR